MSNTSIVITSTRQDTNTTWLTSNTTDTTNFTNDEYQNVILPYWQWIESLPGFQSVSITFPDDLTKITTITFDTTESDNANTAWRQISAGAGNGNTLQNPIANAYTKLLRTKSIARNPERANTYGTVTFTAD